MSRLNISILWLLLSFPMIGHTDSQTSWPRVAFVPWASIPVSKIKDPVLENYVYGVAGSITPKKLPEPREVKYCNVRGQYGVWERVPC